MLSVSPEILRMHYLVVRTIVVVAGPIHLTFHLCSSIVVVVRFTCMKFIAVPFTFRLFLRFCAKERHEFCAKSSRKLDYKYCTHSKTWFKATAINLKVTEF